MVHDSDRHPDLRQFDVWMDGSVTPEIAEVSEQSSRVLDAFELSMDADRRAEFLASGWWRSTTILDDFDEVSRSHPDKTAIVNYRAEIAEPLRLTYADLQNRVERVADFMLLRGIKPGEVISVQLPNWWEFPVIALATLRVGAVLNPVLPIHRAREVSFISNMLRPRMYFFPKSFRSFEYLPMIAEIWPSPSDAPLTVAIDPPGAPSFGKSVGHPLSFEKDVLATPTSGRAGPGTHRERGIDGDLVSDIQFTSGTTGEPKGVGHVHSTLVARTRALFDSVDLDQHDVVFMPSPITHSTGLLYGILAPLTTGMTTVLQDVWDAKVGLDAMRAEKVSWTFISTTFLVDLVRSLRTAPVALDSLRYVISGGAAIPPTFVTEASDLLDTRIVAAWGMTENGAVSFTSTAQSPDAAALSDGVPCSWMSLRVLDADGAVAAVGETGQLVVRGASQMLGYVHRPRLTDEVVDSNGWFCTGDLARLQPDGSVRITGRIKDLIVRGGENIPVDEVEKLLYSHPAVLDVAVVPYPDDRLGERACAVIVSRPETHLSLSDLTEHLETFQISKTYWPERLEIIESMPRTASGKIKKFELRRYLESKT